MKYQPSRLLLFLLIYTFIIAPVSASVTDKIILPNQSDHAVPCEMKNSFHRQTISDMPAMGEKTEHSTSTTVMSDHSDCKCQKDCQHSNCNQNCNNCTHAFVALISNKITYKFPPPELNDFILTVLQLSLSMKLFRPPKSHPHLI